MAKAIKHIGAARNYESTLGMSAAVQAAGLVFISGQMSVDDNGQLLHKGDCAAQFSQALANVDSVLQRAALDISDVIALDCFLTVVPSDEEYARMCAAHRGRMTAVRPTGTMVRVVALPVSDALVCISAIALDH